MPRKPKSSSKAKGSSKSAAKSSSYRPTNFSTKNTSLLAVGNAFILSEGKLSRENIINLSSKTLLGQLKNDGYIKESDNKGVYQVTDRFKSEFTKLTGNAKSYGGSGAGEIHSGTISNLTAAIPTSALISNEYKNGQQLVTENRQNKKTPEYKNKVNEMKQEIFAAQRENELNYKNSQSDSSLTEADRVNAEVRYFFEKDNLEFQERILNDNKRGISSPDLEIELTKAQAYEYIDNLRELEEREEYSKYRDQWEETLSQMESYIETSVEEVLVFDIECIDSNYTRNQIQGKLNWERVYDRKVFYFRA